jgi:hypothetical protein
MQMSESGQGFFAIDRRTWGLVCNLGLNEATMHLVLAVGTGKDNRSTKWSTNAGMKYAGIRWERGKPAIERLIREGLVRYGEGHTPSRPRYEMPSFLEISRARLDLKCLSLSKKEQALVSQLSTNESPARRNQSERYRLKSLLTLGIVREDGDDYSIALPPPEPEPIWLPNTLVTGTDRGEESPLRRLRNCGDLWSLRLFVDLYRAQNLRDDGGISPWVFGETYDRAQVGEQGIFNVWAFKRANKSLFWTGPFEPHRDRPEQQGQDHPVWENLHQLERLGLLTFVPHLWNSWNEKVQEAEIIHPYGITGVGGELKEIEIGLAAHRAGQAMTTQARIDSALSDSRGWTHGYRLAPVKNTIPEVQMIGIGRLTYRPHTHRTSSWWAELESSAPSWISHYQELRENAPKSQKIAIGA